METDRRSEIAASVAAHHDLGPGYEQALAEGLVERISAEIDDRIAAQIDSRVSAEVDERVTARLDQYVGCRHVRRASRRARAAESRASRRALAAEAGRPSVLLILGSMVFAMVTTAIVLARGSSPGAGAFMLTALIWITIGLVNVAYVNGIGSTRRNSG
jgi:hypothetical protein